MATGDNEFFQKVGEMWDEFNKEDETTGEANQLNVSDGEPTDSELQEIVRDWE